MLLESLEKKTPESVPKLVPDFGRGRMIPVYIESQDPHTSYECDLLSCKAHRKFAAFKTESSKI